MLKSLLFLFLIAMGGSAYANKEDRIRDLCEDHKKSQRMATIKSLSEYQRNAYTISDSFSETQVKGNSYKNLVSLKCSIKKEIESFSATPDKEMKAFTTFLMNREHVEKRELYKAIFPIKQQREWVDTCIGEFSNRKNLHWKTGLEIAGWLLDNGLGKHEMLDVWFLLKKGLSTFEEIRQEAGVKGANPVIWPEFMNIKKILGHFFEHLNAQKKESSDYKKTIIWINSFKKSLLNEAFIRVWLDRLLDGVPKGISQEEINSKEILLELDSTEVSGSS